MSNYISRGIYQAATSAAIGLSSRTGSLTSSTNATPIVVTAASHGLLGGAITAISSAGVITSASHGLSNGDRIIITGVVVGTNGVSQLNSTFNATSGAFTTWIVNNVTTNTFTVYGLKPFDFDLTYVSGGQFFRPETLKIEGHTTNTAADGAFAAVAGDNAGANYTTKFTLLGSAGNGVGGASGTWRTIPSGTRGVLIQALVATINWRDDGTDPTVTTTGTDQTLYVGDEPMLFEGNIWNFRAINQGTASGALLNYEFVGW